MCHLRIASRLQAREREDAAADIFSVGTRFFAFTCLSALWRLMAADATDSGRRALLASVQPVVQCAFGVVEDQSESLKSTALRTLAQVLASFAGVPDPSDDEGRGLVMDVFAAPYVTALKTCLSTLGASPPIAYASTLAGDVLISGMLDDDGHSRQVRLW